MSKIIKELKTNKYTTIVFFIFLVLLVVAWFVYGMVMPSNGKPVYGTRLDDIKCEKGSSSNIQIDCEYDSNLKNQTSDLKNEIEKNSVVMDAKINVQGKIVNIVTTIKEGTKIKEAKKVTEAINKVLTKEQLKHYDVQIFIKNESKDAKDYPVIGYMSAGTNKFAY